MINQDNTIANLANLVLKYNTLETELINQKKTISEINSNLLIPPSEAVYDIAINYTAPSNGWVWQKAISSNATSSYITITNNTNGMFVTDHAEEHRRQWFVLCL